MSNRPPVSKLGERYEDWKNDRESRVVTVVVGGFAALLIGANLLAAFTPFGRDAWAWLAGLQ